MYKMSSVATVTIEQILVLLKSEVLYPHYNDFNLPTEMVCNPIPLRDRSNIVLTHLSRLEGDFFQVSMTANELFENFLNGLVNDYSLETLRQFHDWLQRHEVNHDYFEGLLSLSLILCTFDGWAACDQRTNLVKQVVQGGYATYHRLLSLHENLRRSWTEVKILSIQDRLESSRSLGITDSFLALGSSSQQILYIEELLNLERAFRFLSYLKHHADGPELSQFVECVRQMVGTDSEWPPEHLASLAMCFVKQ
jgi:hypothetical protein